MRTIPWTRLPQAWTYISRNKLTPSRSTPTETVARRESIMMKMTTMMRPPRKTRANQNKGIIMGAVEKLVAKVDAITAVMPARIVMGITTTMANAMVTATIKPASISAMEMVQRIDVNWPGAIAISQQTTQMKNAHGNRGARQDQIGLAETVNAKVVVNDTVAKSSTAS